MEMTLCRHAPWLGLFLVVGLTACTDFSTPTTYAAMSSGVGFGDYQQHLRARDNPRAAGVPYSVPPETPASSAQRSGAPLPMTSSPTGLAGSGQGAAGSAPLPVTPAASQPPAGNGGPSERPADMADTGSFQPVPFGSRPAGAEIPRSGQVEIVTAAPVPSADTASGPNVMAYALQTRHSVGTEMYRRSNPLRWSRWERNCLQFANQDQAQEAFLAAGGPERDPNHLDPDGDGFACWWDPEVFRRAARIAPAEQGGLSD